MSNMNALGFRLRTLEEFIELSARAAESGEALESTNGTYVRWALGAGVELWAQRSHAGELMGCVPHFSGTGRMRFGITRIVPADQRPLDGGLLGWVDPSSDHEDDAAYPLFLGLPDFDWARTRVECPSTVDVQVVAFANQLECFPTVEAFGKSETGHASESCIPSGLFYPGGKPKEPLESEAIFTGHILHSEVRTNPLTKGQFNYLSVKTLGGVIDLVADPGAVTGCPVVEGVVFGMFPLSARIVMSGL